MSYPERNIVAYLITGIIIMSIYTNYMLGQFQAGLLDGPDAGSIIGWSVIKLIGGSIVVTIVVTILVTIINAIITQETDTDEADERDKQIDLLGMNVGFATFSVLFISLFLGLVFGLSTTLALLGMVYAMWFASIVEGIVRLYVYRQGF